MQQSRTVVCAAELRVPAAPVGPAHEGRFGAPRGLLFGRQLRPAMTHQLRIKHHRFSAVLALQGCAFDHELLQQLACQKPLQKNSAALQLLAESTMSMTLHDDRRDASGRRVLLHSIAQKRLTFSICTAAAPGLAARTRPRILRPYAVNAVHPRLCGTDTRPSTASAQCDRSDATSATVHVRTQVFDVDGAVPGIEGSDSGTLLADSQQIKHSVTRPARRHLLR